MALRRRHIPDSHSDHPNVIPLVDVMLCMIVFYMLAAKIGVDSGIDKSIQIPITVLGKEMQEAGINRIVVNVRETLGQPNVTAMVEAGKEVVSLSVDGSAGKSSLRDVLRALRVGKDGKEGTADDAADLAVVVRGDSDMSYKTFMPVMIAVTDAGVKNIYHNTAKPPAEGTP